ncbi:MAG: phosphoglycerate mutase, partial [Actinobacteria bacterium]|nr:phosphoglycerate mutase [Actinomycetota bacterium]
MHTLLYVCLDGLGDDPIPELDGRTPLEAAETPNLDALARRGRTGTVVTVGPGIA